MPKPTKIQRQVNSRFAKPAFPCQGCALETRGFGFVPNYAPNPHAEILLVGEAPAYDEAALGEPFCLEHTTLVLFADLTWRPLGDVVVGDRLLAFDEEGSPNRDSASGFTNRRYRISTVVGVRHRDAECQRVVSPHGELVGTPDHRVLTKGAGGNARRWLPIGKLQSQQGKLGQRASGLSHLFTPWGLPTTYRQGVISGFFAGEGTIASTKNRGKVNITYAQNQGPTNDEMKRLLAEEGFDVGINNRTKNRLNTNICEHVRIRGGSSQAIRFIGSLRPPRLLSKFLHCLEENPPAPMPDYSPVITRTKVGVRHVVDIQTTSGTFIANGFMVHNCGAAGSMLQRLLKLRNDSKERYRISNCISCVPPGLKLDKMPYQRDAQSRCDFLQQEIERSVPKVVVPMGGVALKRILGLEDAPDVRVQDFHGTVTRDPSNRFWVVPTFHPSYLQRGAVNLMGTVAWFDLQVAEDVAAGRFVPQPIRRIINPPLDWFKQYADNYIAAATQDAWAYPLAVDTEFPDKAPDEQSMLSDANDRSFHITQVNFCYHPDEGVTIPADPEYLAIALSMLNVRAVKYYWYKGADVPRLWAAGAQRLPEFDLDVMWAWKMLQSDLPMGLGFVAPFYCGEKSAWKHLRKVQPDFYACTDGPKTRRVGDGILSDLRQSGQLDAFFRHQHEFHYRTLAPATEIGVLIDRQRLEAFEQKLDTEAARLLAEIQQHVPDELRPLVEAYKKQPMPGTVHPNSRPGDDVDEVKASLYRTAELVELPVVRLVQVCNVCKSVEVVKTHRCDGSRVAPYADAEGKLLEPIVYMADIAVARWFWKEPFNPDSVPQMLALVKHLGLSPGKSKQTGNESVDRATLVSLYHQSGNPVFKLKLDYAAVGKVRGTYARGTRKRLDANSRVHPEITFKPSTQRTAAVNPNIQNVVADKGGKESLAAGFRACVVAGTYEVEEGSEYADV